MWWKLACSLLQEWGNPGRQQPNGRAPPGRAPVSVVAARPRRWRSPPVPPRSFAANLSSPAAFPAASKKKKIDRRPKADWLKWGASVDPVIIGPKFLARSSSYLAPHSIHISTDNLTQTNQNKTACFPFLAENLTFCGKKPE